MGSAADAATWANSAAGANSSRSPLRKSLGIARSAQQGVPVGGPFGLRGQSQKDERAHAGFPLAAASCDGQRPQQALSAIAAPKLYPARINGRRNSRSSHSRAARTSPASASPSCTPSLCPAPRKLKRSTGQPSPQEGSLRTFMVWYTTLLWRSPPKAGWGWQTSAANGAPGAPRFRTASNLPARTGKRDAAYCTCLRSCVVGVCLRLVGHGCGIHTTLYLSLMRRRAGGGECPS